MVCRTDIALILFHRIMPREPIWKLCGIKYHHMGILLTNCWDIDFSRRMCTAIQRWESQIHCNGLCGVYYNWLSEFMEMWHYAQWISFAICTYVMLYKCIVKKEIDYHHCFNNSVVRCALQHFKTIQQVERWYIVRFAPKTDYGRIWPIAGYQILPSKSSLIGWMIIVVLQHFPSLQQGLRWGTVNHVIREN